MAAPADTRSFASRLGRARRLFSETRARRGWFAASVVLTRLVLLKLPMLLGHLGAMRRTRAIRRGVVTRREAEPGVPYLAVVISGGLGDTLVIARFLRDFMAHAGPFRFDIFAPQPKAAEWVFGGMKGFGAAFHDAAFTWSLPEYDLGLRANQFVVVYEEGINWGALRANHALMKVIDTIIRYRPRIAVFVEHHPQLDHFLAEKAVFFGSTRRDYLHHIAGIPYGGDALPVPRDDAILGRLGLTPRRYITVHNGFDPGFVISGKRATKCYPYFGGVVALLRAALPGVAFVQVGTTTSEPIPECDHMLLNQTTLAECSGLVGGALIHLDNEGGLVHLAACLGTRSAVVFGPTPSDYFGYPGNVNIDPPVCGNCWYLTPTWMDICPKGYPTPRCMTERKPETVAARVLAALGEQPAPAAPVNGTAPPQPGDRAA